MCSYYCFKLYNRWENFKSVTLGSHSDSIVACFFEKNSFDLTTISRNGQACVWDCSVEPSDLIPWNPPPKKKKKVRNKRFTFIWLFKYY